MSLVKQVSVMDAIGAKKIMEVNHMLKLMENGEINFTVRFYDEDDNKVGWCKFKVTCKDGKVHWHGNATVNLTLR